MANVIDRDITLAACDECGESPATLLVREARPDEKAVVVRVTVAAYEQYQAAMAPHRWAGYRHSMEATILQDDTAERFVAELDGRIVGSVLYYDAPVSRFGKPYVRLLAVEPAARGMGVGTALMRACLERARRSGSPVLLLHTTQMMNVAVSMYQRMGFTRLPELDFVVDDEGHAIPAAESGRPPDDPRTVMAYRLDLTAL